MPKIVNCFCSRNHYRPQRSCEGYVFTPVCHSVHRRGVCLSACWDTISPEQTPPWTRHTPRDQAPLEQTPPPPGPGSPQSRPPLGADTPREQTPLPRPGTPRQTTTVADGTHPTGMHSCYI